jgi:glycosyltransferase involved in cell wall biosynthesis
VASEDADSMAKAILRMLTDRALAIRLGRAGWEAGRRDFDPDTLAARTVRFYESVIELWNARRGVTPRDQGRVVRDH